MYLGITATAERALPQTLSKDEVGRLASTFDRATRPVWVEDASGACLYRNAAATAAPRAARAPLRFEILDHANRVVGRLVTADQ